MLERVTYRMAPPRIAIGPNQTPGVIEAVRQGGCIPVGIGESADGLVWLSPNDVGGLQQVLDAAPEIRWVQLPFAGVENFVASGVVTTSRVWTCAKGSYAEPVAEHALTLALAGLRRLPQRIRATTWEERSGTSLFDSRVTIVGGGGIAHSLISLLAPFRTEITVVKRQPSPMIGVKNVVATSQLHFALSDALVVFLALSLTPETIGIIGASELSAMDAEAWIVNVARGRHIVTDDLVNALVHREIGGAALDVTDPEPLPDEHPLWNIPNCIITPHTADTPEMTAPLLASRIATNSARFAANEPLEGIIDVGAGY